MCPWIEVIHVSGLDARNPNPNPVFQPSRTLCSVYVGASQIQDAKAVAMFLGKLSNVEDLNVSFGMFNLAEVYIQRWKKVAKWILILRQARHSDRETARIIISRMKYNTAM